MTQREEFEAALDGALAALGVGVEAGRRERMFAHYEQMIEVNRQFNITRITAPADAAVKHYADSLSLLTTDWVERDQKTRVLDVGTGAGFPAVPLGIVCDSWSIVAIDGTGKKARFVEASAAALGLTNLEARQARLEDWVRHGNGRFDLVLARAVGKIAELLPDLTAVTQRGGSIVFYKTDDQADAEIAAADPVSSKLRLALNMRRVGLRAGTDTLARQLVRYRRTR